MVISLSDNRVTTTLFGGITCRRLRLYCGGYNTPTGVSSFINNYNAMVNYLLLKRRTTSLPAVSRPRHVISRSWMINWHNGCLRPLLLACLLLLVTACSNRAMYEAIQQNRLQACEELPIPQQAQCKAQYQTDYDDYRRERERASR